MNSQKYIKKYNLSSDNNEYVIQFESMNEEQKIRIILIYNKYNQNLNYSIEKSLNEINREFILTCSSSKQLIDYLSALTKKGQIKVIKKYIFMNIITFLDNDKYIQFNLKRKIKSDQLEEIEDEIFNIYNKLENLEKTVNKQNEEINNIKKEFQKKYEVLESKLNEMNHNINDRGKAKCIGIEINKYKSIMYNTFVFEDKIMKDNNNDIKFESKCLNMNKKKQIFMKEDIEKCDIFIAFNLKNNDPIIAWTTRTENSIINIINMKNQKKFSTIEGYENRIDCLQYFYNYIGDNGNNEFIISLSKSDENNLIAWKINNEDDLSLQIVQKIKIEYRIKVFTMLIKILLKSYIINIFIYLNNNIIIFF